MGLARPSQKSTSHRPASLIITDLCDHGSCVTLLEEEQAQLAGLFWALPLHHACTSDFSHFKLLKRHVSKMHSIPNSICEKPALSSSLQASLMQTRFQIWQALHHRGGGFHHPSPSISNRMCMHFNLQDTFVGLLPRCIVSRNGYLTHKSGFSTEIARHARNRHGTFHSSSLVLLVAEDILHSFFEIA